MLRAILAKAFCRQSSTFITVVVDLDHRDRLADDESVGRQGDIVLESLPKGPELLVVAVCVDGDFLDQLIQSGELLIAAAFSAHQMLSLSTIDVDISLITLSYSQNRQCMTLF